MNGYYTGREHTNVTRRESARATFADRVFDVLFAAIALIVGLLRNKTMRAVVRYSVVAACFFCFIGLIGGIEQGLLSMGMGIVLGLLLIFVEILCLK